MCDGVGSALQNLAHGLSFRNAVREQLPVAGLRKYTTQTHALLGADMESSVALFLVNAFFFVLPDPLLTVCVCCVCQAAALEQLHTVSYPHTHTRLENPSVTSPNHA